jgi:hypothetical protein
MSKETIFKVGDKVYNHVYGWCDVIGVDGSEIHILCNELSYWVCSRLFSFTEYTLQGFSQERPVASPDMNEEVIFYDNNDLKDKCVRRFSCMEGDLYRDTWGVTWKYYKRFKIIDL